MNEFKRRNVSGMYFFDKFPGEETTTPTCFEDCSKEKQEEILANGEKDFVVQIALHLSETLKKVCEQFEIEASKNGE